MRSTGALRQRDSTTSENANGFPDTSFKPARYDARCILVSWIILARNNGLINDEIFCGLYNENLILLDQFHSRLRALVSRLSLRLLLIATNGLLVTVAIVRIRTHITRKSM